MTPLVSSAAPPEDFQFSPVRFDVAQRNLIPGIAAVRAVCEVGVSGEPLVVPANGSGRSTLAIAPGPCSIVLAFAGIDLAIPVLDRTPLGTNSFYLPGVATVSLGIVDLSIDLVTSLNSTSRIEDDIGEMSPRDIAWSAWGAQRIQVRAVDGYGGVAESHLRTEFTYRIRLALSVFALSVRIYNVDLVAALRSGRRPSGRGSPWT